MEQLTNVLGKVREEVVRALNLWPGAEVSAHGGFAVLKEEVDELWDVVRLKQTTPGRREQLEKEAIQTAAMAVRFLLELPGYK